MKLKDLEHEGNEDYDDASELAPKIINKLTTRKTVEVIKENKEELDKERKLKLKEELQKEWLKPENPFLWEGDEDFD